jgi:L-ascorbate metabolism protein UlaG (beta-lactamase superfamily)
MPGIGRRSVLKAASAAAGGLALGSALSGTASAAPVRTARAAGGTLIVRWIGGGVVEMATPDNKLLTYVDAWVWNNAGYTVLKVDRPAEFASPDAFASYVAAKSPDAVLVLLSHDHGDHMGDYFDLLRALFAAGLNVKTTGQSDLLRFGYVQKFRDNGLDPAQIVVNSGAGQNFGGMAQHGAIQTWLVPAMHSNSLAFPAAGFVVDMGGVRFYATGDTDLFGDMRMIADRYHPDLALVCAGGGPYTMGPRDAAIACSLAGVSQAVPIHYAHNAQVLGLEAATQFKQALAELAPGATAQLFSIGESRPITI